MSTQREGEEERLGDKAPMFILGHAAYVCVTHLASIHSLGHQPHGHTQWVMARVPEN